MKNVEMLKCYKCIICVCNNSVCETDRYELCKLKLLYKRVIGRKKKAFKFKRCGEFENLKRNKPNEFWRYFSLHNVKKGRRIPLNAFKNHFEQMFTDNASNQNREAKEFDSTHDFSNFTSSFCELDNPITYNEVCKAMSLIKKSRSSVDKL